MYYKIHKLMHPFTFNPKKKLLVEEFRGAIRSLPDICCDTEVPTAENVWLDFRNNLRKQVLESDPDYFLHWPIILHTMFYPGNKAELSALQESEQWLLWKEGLKETSVGYPIKYKDFPSSSGNLIHHAYLIYRLSETFGIKPVDVKTVFEFGGGYGSTVRLFYQLGFMGTYTIFDLPEFLLLQKFFLRSFCEKENIEFDLSVFGKTEFLSEMSSIPDSISYDLFLAGWSLSESSLEVRKNLLERLKKPKYIAIAYQQIFKEIDNISYFDDFSERMTDYEWVHEPIAHQTGNFFLFGKYRG